MKDTIRVKLTIDTDRNTMLFIRRVLASDDVLLQKLVETAKDHIKSKGIGGQDFTLAGDLKSPSPGGGKPGRRKGDDPLPVCDGETLTIIDYYADKETVAAVDTEDYFFYADTLKSFRYSCKNLTMTVIKERRKGSLVWYAHKRIAGKLKRKYLGKTTNLTAKRLWETAHNLAQDEG